MAGTNGASSPHYKLIKADDLHTLPPVRLLDKTRLVANGFNVIFGPSGSYKSFYMLSLALEVAQTDGVIYVAAEGSSGLSIRVDAWRTHNKKGSGNLQFICEEINLLDSACITRLVQTAKAAKIAPRLVIFDTYARCMPGGDENSAKDAGLAIRHCATIQRTLKSAVAVVHHSNRAETGERGSGALRGAADMMIEITSVDDAVRVACEKAKDYEPWPAENFRFQPVSKSGLLLPAADVSLPQRVSNQEVKILDALSWAIFQPKGASVQQVADSTGFSKATVYRFLNRMKENGLVHQDAKGNPFTLLPDGERALYAAKPHLNKPVSDIEIEVVV